MWRPARSLAPTRCAVSTGDLARFLPGRDIEYLGRIDHQVKIRGFRIELGEIESVLCQHPAVREAVVLAREDTPGDKRLVAYLVANGAPAPEVSALREHLKKQLPDYMVPAALVFLDKLPLTTNGKVDLRALPAPDQARPDLEKACAPPRTTTEEALKKIWNEVLGLSRVGIHDNFFELGGHSLLVTQVLSRVRDAFRVEVLLRRFFEAPTIAELAEVIGSCPGARHEASLDSIRPVGREADEEILRNLEKLSDAEVEKQLDHTLAEEMSHDHRS